MKELTNRQINFARVEFWGATTIFVFLLFFHISFSLSNDWTENNQARVSIPFEHYFFSHMVRYVTFYGAFLIVNFVAVPKLIKKVQVVNNIGLIILVFAGVGIVIGVTDTYLQAYLLNEYANRQMAYNAIFGKSFLYAAWMLLVFGFYTIIKYLGTYLLANADTIRARYPIITRGGIAAFIIWMVTMLLLIMGRVEHIIIAGWGVIAPSGILIYLYSFYSFIPKALTKKRPFLFYLGRVIGWVAIFYFPVALFLLLFVRDGDPAFTLSSFNSAIQLLITAPLSWVMFKYQLRGNEQLFVLKKELGRSNANFDFLRSQINPHFLFNALNTIYGTAIQEKADRTSEGIEKLGNMMRFMLQENLQENISVAREIEYLNNYISLQRLRTDPNPGVRIDTSIAEEVHTIRIAPMLLIPFVENAFKHGISFREPCYIKVMLEIKDTTLYFDVFNSKHPKTETDPEKDKSGIGLNNVKQRLQLLYPNKHELIIRETSKDFVVHLTLQLA